MKYENAVINGMLEDFSTVVCFIIDIIFFDLSLDWSGIIGCIIVASIVVYISFNNLD